MVGLEGRCRKKAGRDAGIKKDLSTTMTIKFQHCSHCIQKLAQSSLQEEGAAFVTSQICS
jgi:hypothetical protein